MSNKNDMKLIMEEWRKTINEIGLQDVGFGSKPSFDEKGNKIPDFHEAQDAELFMFVLQVLDPTGISAWKDLSNSIDEYKKAVEDQQKEDEKAVEDPTLKKTLEKELDRALTNLVNGFSVALSFIDSIPLLTYAIKPVKVLRFGRQGFRKLTKDLIKIDPKLAKASDDIAKKLSRAEYVARKKAGDKSLAGLMGLEAKPFIKLSLGVLGAYASAIAAQVFRGEMNKRDAVRRLKIKLWGDVIDKVYRPLGDPEVKEYLAPLKKVRMSLSDDKIDKTTPEELDNIERFLNTIPQHIYKTMGFENRDGFLTYLEKESAKQINREIQKIEAQQKK